MAFSNSLTLSSGINVPQVYFRIEHITITSKQTMVVVLRAYADRTKAAAAEYVFECPYEIGTENPHKQAYCFIKSQPQFEGSVDC